MGASISSTSCNSGQAHSAPGAVVLHATSPSQLHDLESMVCGRRISEECRLAIVLAALDIKMDHELERKLQQHWVSMQCPNNSPGSLYMHGWKKHGTCSGLNQAYYFQTAIQLHVKYNLLQAFHHEGIYPDGRFYDLAHMQEALGRFIGEDPLITCSLNQQHHVSQIYEVYICLDKVNLLPFECPDNPILQTNCRKSKALFPEFDPRTTSPSPPTSPTRFNPPIRYCTDPNSISMNELALLSDEEESLEFYLDSCDLELDDEELQNFLGNTTVDVDDHFI